MKTTQLIRFYCAGLLFFLSFGSIQGQNWYKGNLHTHSLWSDGDDYPEMVMDWYKANGYQFVGLSDHNTLQEGERWINVPKVQIRQRVYERYLRNFGERWVDSRRLGGDTLQVRLKTLEEYRGLFEEPETFLILRSEELTSSFFGKPVHLNATNVHSLIKPLSGNSIAQVMQNNINAVLEQRAATGQPMFPHINHPNFGWAITAEDMMELSGERFFEVYNGHPSVNNYGDSARLGTEEMWDRINHAYLQQGKPLMYGLATDDSHNYFFFGPKYSNSGRGWVMVNAPDLSPASLIASLEAGNFYSSSGIVLDSLVSNSKALFLKIRQEQGVKYRIEFVGWKKGGKKSQILATVEGAEARYALKPDDLFVRARLVSDKPKFNPFFPGDMEMAWTQPVTPN